MKNFIVSICLLLSSFTQAAALTYLSTDINCWQQNLSCPANSFAVFDEKGCACQNKPEACQLAKREYLENDSRLCKRISFRCPQGQKAFYDTQGCGCEALEKLP